MVGYMLKPLSRPKAGDRYTHGMFLSPGVINMINGSKIEIFKSKKQSYDVPLPIKIQEKENFVKTMPNMPKQHH